MKDTFWFRHDSNAKDDPKCILLIEQLGPEGYGIFWILIELLREQPEYKYPLKLLPSIARRYNTSVEKIKTVISAYELFIIEDENFFFSESLRNRMEALDGYKKALSEAGRRGAQARLKGGLSLAKRIEENRTEPNRIEPNGEEKKETVFFGSGDSDFILIPPKYVNDVWKKIIGPSGMNEFYQANRSSIKYPELAEKFLREKSGSHFEDFKHVHNTFIKFAQSVQINGKKKIDLTDL